MIAILLKIAVSFGAIVVLGGLWFGLQLAVRRWFPAMAPAGTDPFRVRFGCGGGCAGGACDPEEGAENVC